VFGTLSSLEVEIAVWLIDVNKTQRGVNWQMKAKNARYIKL